MFLRDFSIHADEAIVDRYQGGFVQRFHRESTSVVEPYLAALHEQVRTVKTAKLVWEFSDEISELPPHVPGVCRYRWPFDFAAFHAAATPLAKQQLILDAFQAANLWIARHSVWPTKPFEAAYRTIVDRNFVFAGCLKDSWLNSTKDFRVRLFFNWHLDRVELAAALYRNRSTCELCRHALGPDVPAGGLLQCYSRRAKWRSRTRFVVSGSHWSKEWVADFRAAMKQEA
ncbi:hypothetical protein ETAA8_01820 [Anatilimnocola aggregata]|uniref:Uncharacterized protein n=1 Tax=Anatilimnocola aggregata TaxID=2528021 RepID=A0A517Y4D4_9BACT|nr:hypothetical protein [Anatilimnocola aggregata]QDU25121.1 hypothetical protein ETAA8_01820 [Anatilimnocola aggregata]